MKEGFKLGFCLGVAIVIAYEAGKLVERRKNKPPRYRSRYFG